MKLSRDHLTIKAHSYLSKWPLGFKIAKKIFSNTTIHQSVQHAIRNHNLASSQAPRPTDNKQIADQKSGHWDHHVQLVESKVLKGWLDWEFIEVEHIRPNLSGSKSIYYLQHFFSEHLPNMPVKKALSLGCGGGNLERALIHLNAAELIEAYDASPESIRLAKELAEENNLTDRLKYAVCDINKIELQENSYDFIVAKMSLHHFENFDHIYQQISRALKPGGVFMFNEYVGPTRFQWTDLQLSIANRLLQALPKKYRFSAFNNLQLDEIHRPTIQEMIDMDPSEAVNSNDIMPKLKLYFDVIEYKKYGGTILHLLMNHIMANFDTTNEFDVALLKMIFLQEQVLIENNVIDSDFCYVVAKAKS